MVLVTLRVTPRVEGWGHAWFPDWRGRVLRGAFGRELRQRQEECEPERDGCNQHVDDHCGVLLELVEQHAGRHRRVPDRASAVSERAGAADARDESGAVGTR